MTQRGSPGPSLHTQMESPQPRACTQRWLVRVRFTGLACGCLLNPKGEEGAGGLSSPEYTGAGGG